MDNWDQICALVNAEMAAYVGNFATPLTMSEQYGFGEAWGTGTYVRGPDAIWILTAAHVITDVPAGGRLAHLPVSGGQYNAALGTPELRRYPVDIGALPILPKPEFLPPAHRVVEPGSIAPCFRAVDDEFLFWRGFPGYRSERRDPLLRKDLITSSFRQLDMRSLPMLSQRQPDVDITHTSFDKRYHVGAHYPGVAKRARDYADVPLPNAKGMSGSALWDTKFRWALQSDVEWHPGLAEICGVIWAVLENPEVVLATRIEHARTDLGGVLS